MAKQKKAECDCKFVQVLYTLHQMNPKKLSARPAVLVCEECGKRTNVQAVGFTLNVKEENGEE